MFKFINDHFKSLSLPVAMVVLTLVCFVFALAASALAFFMLNGTLPANLVTVVALSSIVASTPMILQSMPTIKYLQNSRERLRRTGDELAERVAELDAAYRDLDLARAHLEKRVADRTRDAEDARRSAERANAAKSTFLAQMSHELRTPLNAVIGFSEMLSHPDALPSDRKLDMVEDYAGTIHRSGKHLLSLVNDLLDLSKIEAGEMALYPETIDLDRFMEDVAALVSPQMKVKGQSLDMRHDALTGPFVADRRAMKQVLLNLLSNAAKYSPPGTRILLAADHADGHLTFTVDDEGHGMEPEDVRRALEPFSRLESAEIAGEHGTGLGLPIVASLVELHGGTLAIESETGAGTTVRVRLPLVGTAQSTQVA